MFQSSFGQNNLNIMDNWPPNYYHSKDASYRHLLRRQKDMLMDIFNIIQEAL